MDEIRRWRAWLSLSGMIPPRPPRPPNKCVRAAGRVQTLDPSAAPSADAPVILLLRSFLRDSRMEVRTAAVEGLCKLSFQGVVGPSVRPCGRRA